MLSSLLFCVLIGAEVEDKLFSYFTNNVTVTGKVLDRESDRKKVSVAATGFGMYVWAIGAQQGRITENEALSKVKTAFRNTIRSNPDKNRGWFYHFTDPNGTPISETEVSTVDSAIFYLCARRAASLLNDKDFKKEVETEISKVDTDWMMKGEYLRHGLFWDGDQPKFINVVWDNYSEGIIIYRLFNLHYEPKQTCYDLSLFAYYYPLCFFDEPLMTNNLQEAIKYQQEKYGYWGITATDTQDEGYKDFEANTISPLAIATITTYLHLSNKIDEDIFQAKNRLTKWSSTDRIGIDDGACFILLWKSKK